MYNIYIYKKENDNKLYYGNCINNKFPIIEKYIYATYEYIEDIKEHNVEWHFLDYPLKLEKVIIVDDRKKCLIFDTDTMDFLTIRKLLITRFGKQVYSWCKALCGEAYNTYVTQNNFYMDEDLTSHVKMIQQLTEDDIEHENFASGFMCKMSDKYDLWTFSMRNTNFDKSEDIQNFVLTRFDDDLENAIFTFRTSNYNSNLAIYFNKQLVDWDIEKVILNEILK